LSFAFGDAREVTPSISGATQAASETGATAGHVLIAVSTLSKRADRLSCEVDTFMGGVMGALARPWPLVDRRDVDRLGEVE
jgi:hypothetical protein